MLSSSLQLVYIRSLSCFFNSRQWLYSKYINNDSRKYNERWNRSSCNTHRLFAKNSSVRKTTRKLLTTLDVLSEIIHLLLLIHTFTFTLQCESKNQDTRLLPRIIAICKPIFTARRYAKRGICCRRVSVCVCVCPSHSGIVSKWLNIGSRK